LYVISTGLPQSAAKSSQVGFSASINAIPPPFLDLRLASDSGFDMLEHLVVNQPMNAILARKLPTFPGFVLQNPWHQKPSHSNIDHTAFTGDYVHEISLATHGRKART
jgi:hypothetical protein